METIIFLPFVLMFQFLLMILFMCSLVLAQRNSEVHLYRMELLKKIELIVLDEEVGSSWEWRIAEFKKVNYDEMVYKFWKPLDSFYPDKKFINTI